MALTLCILAIFIIGAVLLYAFSLTLTEEECQEELDAHVRRRLSHRQGD